MLSNEQIRDEHLSVIETNRLTGFALSHIMQKSARSRSVWESDTWITTMNGELAIDIENDLLRVSYLGHQDYDLVVEVNDLRRNTVEGDQRYVVYQTAPASFRGLVTSGRLQIGLNESRLYWGGTHDETNQVCDTNTGFSIRKNPKPYRFEPTLRYIITNANFRKTLNKCKNGTFCIITRNNKIGIFANGEDAPTVYPLHSDGQEFTDAIAGVDYLTIYNSLYRRKQSDLGLMNRLSSIGDFDITEFGIVDNRVYVRIGGEGITATFTYHSVTGIPEVEIPASTTRRRRRRQTQEVIPNPVEVWEDSLNELSDHDEVVWTTEEQDRLILWQAAHGMWCIDRNQDLSNSRAVWFTHYSMGLIRNGDAPDELDIQIMSKV